MGAETGIAWTDSTFNPWIGCTRVSEGCRNCYAEAQDHRWGHDRWGPGKLRQVTSASNWRLPLQWNRQAEANGKRHRVFCASLADVFDPEAPEGARDWLWALIDATPWLDWQLLTKRPELIKKSWPGWRHNVWIGTTVENQEAADKRIPHLLEVDAKVRFLSCEPLIGPVRLAPVSGIDWVIVGGESGPGARAMHLTWARNLVEYCQMAGVAVFVKQLGAWPAISDVEWRTDGALGKTRVLSHLGAKHVPEGFHAIAMSDGHGSEIQEFPSDMRVREFPEPRRG